MKTFILTPVIGCRPFQGVSCLSPKVSWDKFQFTHNMNEYKRSREVMDGSTKWNTNTVNVAQLIFSQKNEAFLFYCISV